MSSRITFLGGFVLAAARRIFVVVVIGFATAGAAQSVPLVRVVIVDTSGSMSIDGRLDTAKAEILSLATQSPPTKDSPIILVSFSDEASAVTFKDLPALKSHLATLTPNGGTHIPKGLLAGLKSLQDCGPSDNVIVLFFSDGQDGSGDAAALQAAEDKLNDLFATRSKKGLDSVLFVKRWEGQQADLLARMAKQGHAQVIDGKDLKIVPVTLTPGVTVRSASWVKGAPLTVEIDGEATLGLTGIAFDPALPTAALRCSTPGVTFTPLTLRPGDPKPTPFRLRLTVSRDTATSGKAKIHFTLGPTGRFPPKGGIVLPQLTTTNLTITADLPPLALRYALSAGIAMTEQPTWSDPLASKPLLRGMLTCSLRADPDVPWPGTIKVRLLPEGCRLVTGKDAFDLSSSGSTSIPVTLEADPVAPGAVRFPVALTLRPEPPASGTVEPPEARVTQDGPTPAPVDTHITAQIQSVSEARWCNLAQGLATFHADVSFRVAGPIPAGNRIILHCPPPIRNIRINPAVLQTGTQTVRLTIEARCPSAPKIATFDIQIQPPPTTGAVRFSTPPPIRLRVAGPPPVQLILTNPDGTSPSVTVRDHDAPILLAGIPALVGVSDQQIASGVSARIQGGPRLGLRDVGPVPVQQPFGLPLELDTRDTSFLFDTVIKDEISVMPDSPSDAIVGSQQTVTVTLEAPFKTWLFYGASAVAVAIMLWIACSIYRRRSAEVETDADRSFPEV